MGSDYPKPFIDDYLKLVWAAASRDPNALYEASLKLKFLTVEFKRELVLFKFMVF